MALMENGKRCQNYITQTSWHFTRALLHQKLHIDQKIINTDHFKTSIETWNQVPKARY